MLILTEWGTSAPVLISQGQRRILETTFGASVRATAITDRVSVTPGSVIGSVTVDGTALIVKPKIPIDRVLFMTAFTADPYHWQDTWSSIARMDDLVEGMTELFLRVCRTVTSRGLLRSYRTVDADTTVVKGRIKFEVQARRPLPVPVAVRYQVHDDDIAENQIIREALKILRSIPAIGTSNPFDLNSVWKQFRDFSPLSDPVGTLNSISWTRLNEHYRPVLELARTILENSMAHLSSGTISTLGFTLRMPDVFESFVRTALRHFSELSHRDFPDDWSSALTLDDDSTVKLLPDLGVRVGGEWKFVGDVKYKRDTGSGSNADLYQLLAYATATHLPSATLLYAHGPAALRHHRTRHSGVELRIRHLDLTQSPQQVLAQLALIARDEIGSPHSGFPQG